MRRPKTVSRDQHIYLMYRRGMGFTAMGREFKLTRNRIQGIVAEEEARRNVEYIKNIAEDFIKIELSVKLEELDFPIRIHNALWGYAGIETSEELFAKTRLDLLKIPGFGPKSLKFVLAFCKRMERSLAK